MKRYRFPYENPVVRVSATSVLFITYVASKVIDKLANLSSRSTLFGSHVTCAGELEMSNESAGDICIHA